MTTDEIKSLAEKVNDYWIKKHPGSGDCAWERGAYFLGCMAAYDILGKKEYLDYALKWAEDNGWSFYNNGKPNTLRNADNKICGQTYLRLMELVPKAGTMDNMIRDMEIVLCDPDNDYWWWVDTIYMALPFYTMMGVKLNDERYFEKVHRLFYNAKTERSCYDTEEHLWYRDERFLPEVARGAFGGKIFWGRGNGWVFAGLARTLEILPKTNAYYSEYEQIFRDMAAALVKYQQPDGFWRCDICEPRAYDTPETSGTALITYGLMLGINLGILDEGYLKYAQAGFGGINKIALEDSGKIGYVQVVADRPGPINKDAENDYAVGTYLLICREFIRYREKDI